ncbi:MAG: hypothetical protein KGL39_48050 [Patescibacteria group bacterium]|nr:hypothetical protein [Patescibacteria group bacterium]
MTPCKHCSKPTRRTYCSPGCSAKHRYRDNHLETFCRECGVQRTITSSAKGKLKTYNGTSIICLACLHQTIKVECQACGKVFVTHRSKPRQFCSQAHWGLVKRKTWVGLPPFEGRRYVVVFSLLRLDGPPIAWQVFSDAARKSLQVALNGDMDGFGPVKVLGVQR